MHDPLLDAVHGFWFGEIRDGFCAQDRGSLWFGSAATTDALIERLFGAAVRSALGGGLEAWRAQPRGGVALVLLLDQFTRNIFRGAATAFAGDARARSVARALLETELAPIERVFMLLPFEHAEDLAEQEFCVAQFERLCAEVEPGRRAAMEDYRRFAVDHRDIIARFGRFPHRNRALRRGDTPEETAWLAGGGRRFGQ